MPAAAAIVVFGVVFTATRVNLARLRQRAAASAGTRTTRSSDVLHDPAALRGAALRTRLHAEPQAHPRRALVPRPAAVGRHRALDARTKASRAGAPARGVVILVHDRPALFNQALVTDADEPPTTCLRPASTRRRHEPVLRRLCHAAETRPDASPSSSPTLGARRRVRRRPRRRGVAGVAAAGARAAHLGHQPRPALRLQRRRERAFRDRARSACSATTGTPTTTSTRRPTRTSCTSCSASGTAAAPASRTRSPPTRRGLDHRPRVARGARHDRRLAAVPRRRAARRPPRRAAGGRHLRRRVPAGLLLPPGAQRRAHARRRLPRAVGRRRASCATAACATTSSPGSASAWPARRSTPAGSCCCRSSPRPARSSRRRRPGRRAARHRDRRRRGARVVLRRQPVRAAGLLVVLGRADPPVRRLRRRRRQARADAGHGLRVLPVVLRLGAGLGAVCFAVGGAVRLFFDERRLFWMLVPPIIVFVAVHGLPGALLRALAHAGVPVRLRARRLRRRRAGRLARAPGARAAPDARGGGGRRCSAGRARVLAALGPRPVARGHAQHRPRLDGRSTSPPARRSSSSPSCPTSGRRTSASPSPVTPNGNRWNKYPLSRSSIDPTTGEPRARRGRHREHRGLRDACCARAHRHLRAAGVLLGRRRLHAARPRRGRARGGAAGARLLRGARAPRARSPTTVSPYARGKGPVTFNFDWTFNYYPLAYNRPGPTMTIYRLTRRRCAEDVACRSAVVTVARARVGGPMLGPCPR